MKLNINLSNSTFLFSVFSFGAFFFPVIFFHLWFVVLQHEVSFVWSLSWSWGALVYFSFFSGGCSLIVFFSFLDLLVTGLICIFPLFFCLRSPFSPIMSYHIIYSIFTQNVIPSLYFITFINFMLSIYFLILLRLVVERRFFRRRPYM